jgi:hypothetical protein
MTETEIRTELVQVLDQLNALPRDAFAERAELRKKQDNLREALARAHGDDLAEMKDEWNSQAGAKLPPHKGNPAGKIVSPNEGGSGA